MGTANNNATNGRVYGGDTGLIHIAEGERANMGNWLAAQLDERMRAEAIADLRRTSNEARSQDLCPGCYMVALFNTAVCLAKQNGQSMTELGNSMAAAFAQLAANPNPDDANIESIGVELDKDEPEPALDYWSEAAIASMQFGGAPWAL